MKDEDFTGYFDDGNKPIFLGEILKSIDGYKVMVIKGSDGDYVGKLICSPDHSCADIPYSLNNGKGYYHEI